MKIHSILLYSYDGKLRKVTFNLEGLSIITGRSSTGKSALTDIVEYCMGRSTFNIPEGVIKDKVAWYGVIYQFNNDQILIAKPTPPNGAASCSLAMVRRGVNIEPPAFAELATNSDDSSVINIISTLLGIPENKTDVPIDRSRPSFITTIQHTYYYLFQKQEIVANKEQLFYRQNEPFQPQAIIDTLPILLGVTSDDRYNLDTKLRIANRDLKIIIKQIEETEYYSKSITNEGLGLVSEAKAVGMIESTTIPTNEIEVLTVLREALKWTPESNPKEDINNCFQLEAEILALREERNELGRKLEVAKRFSNKSLGFSNELIEQKTRLESIKSLPYNKETGDWQWPFSEKNLGLGTPIAKILVNELKSLDDEMDSVHGEKPKLDKYIQNTEESVRSKSKKISDYSGRVKIQS